MVQTGNVESYRARIEGKRWRLWIPPTHLLYFSPNTIGDLAKKCGLKVITHETSLPYEKYFRQAGLYGLLNTIKLSDNVVYYMKKVNQH